MTKVALEPVWYLPGIAARFGITEGALRKGLFQFTGGMYPELVTRHDLKIFLPPIGGATAYIFGPVANVADLAKELTVRVHDECNGSDVFGSDICTCRPYLAHGIEEAIKTAQGGGSGLIVYYRKEGRALGEVTKFLSIMHASAMWMVTAPQNIFIARNVWRCARRPLSTINAGCFTLVWHQTY